MCPGICHLVGSVGLASFSRLANVLTFLKSQTILNNESLKNESVIEINMVDGDRQATYSFSIKKDEEEKEEKLDDKKEDDGNKTNSFLKKYEMYIGLGVFGLGLFSLLIAILTRPKKSQIM